MNGVWPAVKLSDVLRRSEETIELQPDISYRQITVKLWGKGVVLRGILTGAEIAASRQMVARPDQFILSRIDARNGALGIVPSELDGAVVTNDFPLFNIVENRLSPAYLGWMCRTASFVDECKQASEGTTNRVRLQEDKFLAREIPLPPLSEQRRMVARIEELATQINEARALRQQAAEEAKALLSSAQSGLTQSKAANKLMVSELLSEGGLRNGRSVKSTGIESEIRCLVLSALRNGRINIEDSKPVPILPSDAIPFQVQSGDVYVIRGNGSKDLCGRAGLACEGSERVIFPDLFIKVPLLKEKILPEYFVAAWNSSYTRTFIEEKAKTTSGIWKINQGHILSTPIPVPTIPEQRNIVVELDGLQAEVDALKRLQSETSAELDALLPSILDRAFKGEL